MFDLPIPQLQPEEPAPAVTPVRPPERFRAEALEYEGGSVRGPDWIAVLGALAGVAFGYFVNGAGNQMFAASLLSTAVFLYVSRR